MPVVMSLWLVTTAVGDLLAGIVYNLLEGTLGLSQSQMYLVFAALMLANAAVFGCIAARYMALH